MSADDSEPTTSTLDLVADARAGSREALSSLYQRSAPMLLAWAETRVLSSLRSSIDGDDLLQETWCRVVIAFERYDPAKQTFRPWLLGIARNVLLENLRRIARSRLRSTEPHGQSSSILDAEAAHLTTIRTQLATLEVLGEFRSYVDGLDELDREILLQCGFEELHVNAVAERLGLGTEALGKRWQRLRAKLRESSFARKFELVGES